VKLSKLKVVGHAPERYYEQLPNSANHMLIATEEKKRPHMIDIKKMESAFIQEVNSL